MGIPGFAAESSLYRTARHYHGAATWGSSAVGFYDSVQLSGECLSANCGGGTITTQGPCCYSTLSGTTNAGCCGTGQCCYPPDGNGSTCVHEGQQCCSNGNVCDVGKICCGSDACLDPNDEHSCGGCENECLSGQTCCNGSCTDCGGCSAQCDDGKACDSDSGECIDILSDPNNCGGVDVQCSAGQMCCGGTCVIQYYGNCGTCGTSCDSDNPDCCPPDGCTDTTKDPNNCGECGNICGPGEQCCPAPDFCASLDDDIGNCGECGHICKSGMTCSNGMCTCPVKGEIWCADMQGCVPQSNSNCGCGDGVQCGPDQSCSGGKCICNHGGNPCGQECCGDSQSCSGATCICTQGTLCGQECCTSNEICVPLIMWDPFAEPRWTYVARCMSKFLLDAL